MVEEFASREQVRVEVVEYLKTPLTLEQLSTLRRTLKCTAAEMVRSSEEEFALLKLVQANEENILQAIVAHPKLMQRPIVVFRDKAVIGRPPERVADLLNAD